MTMKNLHSKNVRVLGIAPSSYGCGFAVMEGKSALVDWGVKSVKGGDKNAQSLAHVGKLISRYRPDVIVVEDTRTKSSRRSARIRELIEEIVISARNEN